MVKKFKILEEPIPRLFLCRHGHTDLNGNSGTSVDKIRGWANVPLNDEGREDANKARQKLLQLSVKPNKMYVSNLDRTIETAAIINKSFNIPMEETINLRPWDLGELTGKESLKVKPQMDYFVANPDMVVPKGESFNNFKYRYLGFLEKVILEVQKNKSTILLVTHFRDVKMAEAWVKAGMKADLSVDDDTMNKNDVEPGDVLEIPLQSR
jgi:broad specificity phosphatase PhoE